MQCLKLLCDAVYRDDSTNDRSEAVTSPSALFQSHIFECLNVDHRGFMAYCYAVVTDL